MKLALEINKRSEIENCLLTFFGLRDVTVFQQPEVQCTLFFKIRNRVNKQLGLETPKSQATEGSDKVNISNFQNLQRYKITFQDCGFTCAQRVLPQGLVV